MGRGQSYVRDQITLYKQITLEYNEKIIKLLQKGKNKKSSLT